MALLVAFEGIDGSGKGTQAKLLADRLEREGIAHALISFPRYEATLFGRAVGDFLNGRYGALDEVDPHLVSLLYAGDRFESRELLLDAMAANEVVVLDRYVPSNIAHQGAKVPADERRAFIDWVSRIEYDIFRLPRADLVILLDVPVEVARKQIAMKQSRTYTDKPADLQEADAAYLEAVREVYLEVSAAAGDWRRVECVRESSVRTIDDIAIEIWNVIQSRRPGGDA